MKRTEWEFDFSARDLLAAARKKQAYHEGRRVFWTAQHAKALEEFRANEGELATAPQKISGTYSNMVSHARSRVDDCQAKVREHTTHGVEYARWDKLFERGLPDATMFKLRYADVEYFDLLVPPLPVVD